MTTGRHHYFAVVGAVVDGKPKYWLEEDVTIPEGKPVYEPRTAEWIPVETDEATITEDTSLIETLLKRLEVLKPTVSECANCAGDLKHYGYRWHQDERFCPACANKFTYNPEEGDNNEDS